MSASEAGVVVCEWLVAQNTNDIVVVLLFTVIVTFGTFAYPSKTKDYCPGG